MFIVKKGKIKEIEVLSIENGAYNIQEVESKRVVENVHRNDVCDTYEEAELVLKEIAIKGKYKRMRRNKKGLHTCAWCGRQGKDLTIDHKIALDSFGGKGAIRKDENTWKKAWNFKNLQMLCEECNSHKANFVNVDGKMSLDDIDYHARVLNNKKILKKSVHKDSPATKIGYGIATSKWSSNKKELAEYVAKADSNILRLDIILGSVEAYDFLPKTV